MQNELTAGAWHLANWERPKQLAAQWWTWPPRRTNLQLSATRLASEAGGFGRLWMCIFPEHPAGAKLAAGILAEVERVQMKEQEESFKRTKNASAIQ